MCHLFCLLAAVVLHWLHKNFTPVAKLRRGSQDNFLPVAILREGNQ